MGKHAGRGRIAGVSAEFGLVILQRENGVMAILPSIVISLLGMPYASYPMGALNAAYDLTMYLSGFFNGAIALLIYRPSNPE